VDAPDDLIWVAHAAYPALFNPPEDKPWVKASTFRYFTDLAEWMRRVGSRYAVIHLGGTKDRDPRAVVDQAIQNWQAQTLLRQFCQDHGLRFLIENVAAKYPVNQDLNYVATIAASDPTLGWCLDTAHSNGAGVPWPRVLDILENPTTRPTIIHANYPGSEFGSGKDRHGYRYLEATPVGPEDKAGWLEVVRKAWTLGIPMIFEGSGSYEGDAKLEVLHLRTLLMGP